MRTKTQVSLASLDVSAMDPVVSGKGRENDHNDRDQDDDGDR
jgi:hypothetical protein